MNRLKKGIMILVGLILILGINDLALAQGPSGPQHSDPYWQASYWNNKTLSGAPVLQREEPELNYDWGTGSPHPSVNADQFSARWTRYLDVSGSYRFTATGDDGFRVYLDGTLIINEWYDHAAKTVSVERTLSTGHHLLVFEFYENADVAVARFSWTPVIAGWRGEYYNNKSLNGTPALVRGDAKIDFAWGTGSPAPGVIGRDNFSVRWTRTLNLDPGNYRFSMTVDDGGRLWVNGHKLIDAWWDQAPHTYTGEIFVPAGGVAVKMEYYEASGGATARLSWAKPGASPNTVIVDNGDKGFSKGGSPTGWHIAYEGYGGSLLWTQNNDRIRSNYNWARWYPNLKSARYEVFVYIPHRYSTTAKARYWVSHAGGLTLRVVNQSAYSNQWVSLGTYKFRGNNQDYVSLADVTYEPYLSKLIAFDAVKWVKR